MLCSAMVAILIWEKNPFYVTKHESNWLEKEVRKLKNKFDEISLSFHYPYPRYITAEIGEGH